MIYENMVLTHKYLIDYTKFTNEPTTEDSPFVLICGESIYCYIDIDSCIHTLSYIDQLVMSLYLNNG